MPFSHLSVSERDRVRDDAVRLRDMLRGVRGAKPDARDFALFDVHDQLHGMGVPKAQIDAFDAHDDDALDDHIGQAHAVATALGAADDEDHSALFGGSGQDELAGGLGADEISVSAAKPPVRNIPGARLPGIVQSQSERIYRPLFISPDDAQNPGDRLQIVPVGNATDEDMAKIDRSIRYLNKSPLARQTIDEGLGRGVRVTPTAMSVDRYENNPAAAHFRDIEWDPRSQLRLLNDDRTLSDRFQSPAMGLMHEFGHALQPLALPGTDGEAEETRIRLGVETPIAEALGEGVRTNHSGDLFLTNDPISQTPGKFDYDYERRLRDDWERARLEKVERQRRLAAPKKG